MGGRLILALLSLVALAVAAAQVRRCVRGGMEPSQRLIDKNSKLQRNWTQVVGNERTVCVALMYEVQWSDGVVATDIMLGIESLFTVANVAFKNVSNEANELINIDAFTAVETYTHRCREVDPEKMQAEIQNTYRRDGRTPYDNSNDTRFNMGWLCVCIDSLCNDLTFINTRFAKIKHYMASIGDTIPLQSIDLDAYDAAMKVFWGVEEFGKVGHCFEGFVNHPYGFAELDTIDLLLSSVSGNMFYSGYIAGPMWCAISFGRLSSSYGSIVPFSRNATVPFANGAFVEDKKATEEMERNDPHMKEFQFKCFRRDTEAVKEIKLADWYRAYLPPESHDSPLLICACNSDLCNNTDNAQAIRQHFLASKKKTELSSDEFEESSIWSPAEVGIN